MGELERDSDRYNRRTRAVERQANAFERIATALEVQALAAVTTAQAENTASRRVWSVATSSKLMKRLLNLSERLPNGDQ